MTIQTTIVNRGKVLRLFLCRGCPNPLRKSWANRHMLHDVLLRYEQPAQKIATSTEYLELPQDTFELVVHWSIRVKVLRNTNWLTSCMWNALFVVFVCRLTKLCWWFFPTLPFWLLAFGFWLLAQFAVRDAPRHSYSLLPSHHVNVSLTADTSLSLLPLMSTHRWRPFASAKYNVDTKCRLWSARAQLFEHRSI